MRTLKKLNKTIRYLITEWELNGKKLFQVKKLYIENCGYRGPIIRSAKSNFETLARAEASVNRAVRKCIEYGWIEEVAL
jgi:hypothetical protein